MSVFCLILGQAVRKLAEKSGALATLWRLALLQPTTDHLVAAVYVRMARSKLVVIERRLNDSALHPSELSMREVFSTESTPEPSGLIR